jgi:hypothetical protein
VTYFGEPPNFNKETDIPQARCARILKEKLTAEEREGMFATTLDRHPGGWSKNAKISKSQVTVFRGFAIHVLRLVCRPVGYSQWTPALLQAKHKEAHPCTVLDGSEMVTARTFATSTGNR